VRIVLLPKLCSQCRGVVEKAVADLDTQKKEFRRLWPKMRRQRAVASRACDDLLRERQERQIPLIRNCHSKYRSRPLAEELLRRGQKVVHRDPQECLRLGHLAWEVADQILGMHDLAGGEAGLQDLKTLVRAHQGNACRAIGLWDEAKGYFNKAFSCLALGSGDPRIEVTLSSFYASYLRECQCYPKALSYLESSERLCLELGDGPLRGKLMLQRGAALQEMGAPARALPVLEECLGLLNPRGSHHLFGMAYQTLSVTLCELGSFVAAVGALEESDAAFARCAPEIGRSMEGHRIWTRGKVNHGLERFEAAEGFFLTAQDVFSRGENPYDTALVSLDLAMLYFERGRLEDLVSIAEEAYEGLRSQELRPEANAALLLLLEASRRQDVEKGVIQAVIQQLRPYRCPRKQS